MSYTVLARRYRSRTFDELVGQEPIARTLQNAIASNRTAHAYLFCGTRGVGKTSMARIFAKAMNTDPTLAPGLGERDEIAGAILRGDDLDVIEIDGASNRGVQEARDLIAGAGLSPTRCPFKIYIIDEVHMLTREAFNALLKTMEEPPSHVKFILCTTDPQKVPATIQSRCQRFDFRAIATSEIAAQLRRILVEEGIEAEDELVHLVARLGRGSMRDALSLLDRLISAGDAALTVKLAEEMLGLPDQTVVVEIARAVIDADPAAALRSGAELIARGATEEQALEMITEHLRSLMIAAACGPDSELLELSPDAVRTAREQAQHFDVPGLVHMIAVCDAAARAARGSVTARALFDAALVRLCVSERLADVAALLAGGSAGPPATSSPTRSRSGGAPKATPSAAAKKKTDDVPRREPAAVVEVKAPAAPTAAPRPVPPAPSPRTPSPAAPAPSALATPAAPASAGASTAVADIPSAQELWCFVTDASAGTPVDQSRVDGLVPQAFDGRTLRLIVADDAASKARYLANQATRIAELVQRATGRRVRVEIDAPAAGVADAGRAAPGLDPQRVADAQRMPVVRKAMELFDAAVIDVVDLGRGTKGAPDV